MCSGSSSSFKLCLCLEIWGGRDLGYLCIPKSCKQADWCFLILFVICSKQRVWHSKQYSWVNKTFLSLKHHFFKAEKQFWWLLVLFHLIHSLKSSWQHVNQAAWCLVLVVTTLPKVRRGNWRFIFWVFCLEGWSLYFQVRYVWALQPCPTCLVVQYCRCSANSMQIPGHAFSSQSKLLLSTASLVLSREAGLHIGSISQRLYCMLQNSPRYNTGN